MNLFDVWVMLCCLWVFFYYIAHNKHNIYFLYQNQTIFFIHVCECVCVCAVVRSRKE